MQGDQVRGYWKRPGRDGGGLDGREGTREKHMDSRAVGAVRGTLRALQLPTVPKLLSRVPAQSCWPGIQPLVTPSAQSHREGWSH